MEGVAELHEVEPHKDYSAVLADAEVAFGAAYAVAVVIEFVDVE